MTIFDLETVLDRALLRGPIVTPSKLTEELERLTPTTPVASEQYDALFDAAEEEFPFFATAPFKAPSAPEIEHWTGVLRWLAAGVSQWDMAADGDLHRLHGLLGVAAAMDRTHRLWALLGARIAPSADFLLGLQRIMLGTSTIITTDASADQRTCEAVANFVSHDASLAWDQAADRLDNFWAQVLPPWPVSQAARALAALAPQDLAQASSALPNLIDAFIVVSALTACEAALLSKATGSDRVRFTAICHLAANRQAVLDETTSEALTDALCEVAGDLDRWRIWMTALARYPVR